MESSRLKGRLWVLTIAMCGAISAPLAVAQTVAVRGSAVYSIQQFQGQTVIGKNAANGSPGVRTSPLPNGELPVALAVEADDIVWAVSQTGSIYRWALPDRGKPVWTQQQGSASDIAIGPDGSVYVVGTGGAGDKPVFKWSGSNWLQLNQAAGVHVYINQCNFPEIIKANNQQYQVSLTAPGLWDAVSATPVREITIGAAGRFALGVTPVPTRLGNMYPLMKWASEVKVAGSPPVWGWYETASIAAAIAVNDAAQTLIVADPNGLTQSVSLSTIVLKRDSKLLH